MLNDAIDSYKVKENGFDEPELWHLLYALCAAEEEYATITGNRMSRIGDIRPQNVFISDKGKIKVACPYSWPDEQRPYAKI